MIILIVQYVPSWMPGAGFKRQAEEWSKTVLYAINHPFEELKKQMVCLDYHPCALACLMLHTGSWHCGWVICRTSSRGGRQVRPGDRGLYQALLDGYICRPRWPTPHGVQSARRLASHIDECAARATRATPPGSSSSARRNLEWSVLHRSRA